MDERKIRQAIADLDKEERLVLYWLYVKRISTETIHTRQDILDTKNKVYDRRRLAFRALRATTKEAEEVLQAYFKSIGRKTLEEMIDERGELKGDFSSSLEKEPSPQAEDNIKPPEVNRETESAHQTEDTLASEITSKSTSESLPSENQEPILQKRETATDTRKDAKPDSELESVPIPPIREKQETTSVQPEDQPTPSPSVLPEEEEVNPATQLPEQRLENSTATQAKPSPEQSVVSSGNLNPSHRILYFLVGVILLLVIVIFVLVFRNFRYPSIGQIPTSPVSVISTQTPPGTARPASPSTGSTITGSGANDQINAPTSSPSPSNTAIPIPTDTPAPTLTPTALPTAVVLFQDDFADGIDTGWDYNRDLVQQNNGFITAIGDLSLFLPANWINYQVRIKYGNWGDSAKFVSTIGLRAQDSGNMIALTGGPGPSDVFNWSTLKDGVSKLFKNHSFQTKEGGNGVIVLEANRDKFLVVGSPPVTSTLFPQGGLYINIRNAMDLYSVTVTALP